MTVAITRIKASLNSLQMSEVWQFLMTLTCGSSCSTRGRWSKATCKESCVCTYVTCTHTQLRLWMEIWRAWCVLGHATAAVDCDEHSLGTEAAFVSVWPSCTRVTADRGADDCRLWSASVWESGCVTFAAVEHSVCKHGRMMMCTCLN